MSFELILNYIVKEIEAPHKIANKALLPCERRNETYNHCDVYKRKSHINIMMFVVAVATENIHFDSVSAQNALFTIYQYNKLFAVFSI